MARGLPVEPQRGGLLEKHPRSNVTLGPRSPAVGSAPRANNSGTLFTLPGAAGQEGRYPGEVKHAPEARRRTLPSQFPQVQECRSDVAYRGCTSLIYGFFSSCCVVSITTLVAIPRPGVSWLVTHSCLPMHSTYFLNAYIPVTLRPKGSQALGFLEETLRECLRIPVDQLLENTHRITSDQAVRLRRLGLTLDLRKHRYYLETSAQPARARAKRDTA